ncbi:unnamed protein product [Candida verbasci]|uniref:Uncharacterized protein n=1 Tax=Candida verbasci TaxID=1227364 RepID=A0A9W4TSL4_9ASCO|nr:unnamed protein product [Candida verbasci]
MSSSNNNLQPISSNSNKLTIPKQHHSHSTSVSSNMSNLFPQYLPSKSHRSTSSYGGISGYKLSRSNTNYTESSYLPNNEDQQSIKTIDKIPSAKPSVTYSDKLWTQIDVLDDVKNMAMEVREKGSFFNEKFDNELNKLKLQQEKLLQTMSSQKFTDLGKNKEHEKQQLYHLHNNTSKNLLSQENIVHEDVNNENEFIKNKMKQDKIDSFFKANNDLDLKNQKNVYNKTNFEEIDQYVVQIKKDLKGLSDAMKHFDESTREIW